MGLAPLVISSTFDYDHVAFAALLDVRPGLRLWGLYVVSSPCGKVFVRSKFIKSPSGGDLHVKEANERPN